MPEQFGRQVIANFAVADAFVNNLQYNVAIFFYPTIRFTFEVVRIVSDFDKKYSGKNSVRRSQKP